MIYLEEVNMKITIDRFEGEYAICEKDDRSMLDIAKTKLPAAAKEGDVLEISGNLITIDEKETTKRSKKIENLTENLWN